jgi:hypothetical protein
MVNLTTKQVETLFDALRGLNAQLEYMELLVGAQCARTNKR